MTDIRDIVGQTSALEKIPSIDQRSQEVRAGKQAIGQLAENSIKRESVAETKESKDKLIRKDSEEQKGEGFGRKKERVKKAASEEETATEKVKEVKNVDIIEVDEGKIIDVKI